MNDLIKKTVKDMNGVCGFSHHFTLGEVQDLIKKAFNDGMLTKEEFNPQLGTLDYFKGEKLMIRIPLNQLG